MAAWIEHTVPNVQAEPGRCLCGCWPRRTWETSECFTCGREVEGLRHAMARTLATITTLPETEPRAS